MQMNDPLDDALYTAEFLHRKWKKIPRWRFIRRWKAEVAWLRAVAELEMVAFGRREEEPPTVVRMK